MRKGQYKNHLTEVTFYTADGSKFDVIMENVWVSLVIANDDVILIEVTITTLFIILYQIDSYIQKYSYFSK